VEGDTSPEQLDLVVGRIIDAEDLPHRGPGYRLTLDLGGRGQREASLSLPPERKKDLVGTQVVCALSGDDALVLAARSHGRGLVLLRPEEEVEEGSPVA
jgi:tRNA-binding EMAP/Myf-like protein